MNTKKQKSADSEAKYIVCPVIGVEPAVYVGEAVTPVVEYLLREQGLPAQELTFPVGTITTDGRLDLCKQNLGPEGAAQIVDAIKKNSWVKHLLLGTNNIGDAGAQVLSEAVAHNARLETLYVGCNNIHEAGTVALCHALEQNSHIRSVWFKRNPIGKASVPALIRLLTRNSNIRTLDLVNTCLEEGFLELFDYLAANNTLERLYLSGNYLTPRYMEAAATMLKKNKSLRGLFVSVNLFGDEGARHLADGLAANTTLEELSVASCGIGEAGTLHLVDGLWQHPALRSLDMGYAPSTQVLKAAPNSINAVAAEKLWQWLQVVPRLEVLNLVKTGMPQQYKERFAALGVAGKPISVIMDGMNVTSRFPLHPDSAAIKSVYR
jgi:Ran GTPase-activating protein (RanGAP) involved in mRNA processing and transport